jgi:hypothetical protein
MKEEEHSIRMLMQIGENTRYVQKFIDVFVDDELETRTLTCMAGGHTYMYVFTQTPLGIAWKKHLTMP